MFHDTGQDESRSISENSTWGIRRKFEQGMVVVNHKKFLGYDKDEEGNLIIDEKQAKIVRRIYRDYIDGKGEVLLTILSSLAQDESKSISENSTWGIRKRFEQEKLHVNTTKFMGYDKDEDGNLIMNEEQSKVVRLIYEKFLNGRNYFVIAKELNEEGVVGWNGKTKWIASTIETMLKNEKYKGDVLLQKTYTVDFLSKKREKNKGQVAQYYVES